MMVHLVTKVSQRFLVSKALQRFPLHFPSRQAKGPFTVTVLTLSSVWNEEMLPVFKVGMPISQLLPCA